MGYGVFSWSIQNIWDFCIKIIMVKGNFLIPCKQKQWRASKNWAFSVFKINFQGQKSTWSFWKWFSYMNIKLGEQLLLLTFSILIVFKELYLVKLCPIFPGLPLFLFTKYENFLWACWFLFPIKHLLLIWETYIHFKN